jgi:hypothetical protein
VVGKGTGAFVLFSRLPIRLRDRLMKSALGLSDALKPADREWALTDCSGVVAEMAIAGHYCPNVNRADSVG